MCSGAGRESVLQLQQSCKEFYGNHVGRGPGMLLCRVNDGIAGFHKPQCMLMDSSGFSYKTHTPHVLWTGTLSCQSVNHSWRYS